MLWLLGAPFLLYLLGALLETSLAPHDPAEWAPAVLFRRLMLGLLSALWVGVALAEIGRFGVPALAAIVVVLSAALAAHAARAGVWRRVGQVGCWGRARELWALAAVLALGAALYARPGEDVLGARDPGIYFATGVAIARNGTLLQYDPALRALAEDLGDASINYWLFQSVHGWPLRFPGQLFVRDLPGGVVEPGFLPWYPVAVAYAVGAGGAAAGLWVNPALAVLALAAVYLAGRALLGPAPAALGTALLAVNLAQVWFARYTMAEPATQLLVWTGLYALAAQGRRPTLALGLLAGLAWGGALLARVDALLLTPAVALYLAWRLRTPATRASALLTLAVLALGALHAALHAWLLAPGYTSMVFSPATLAVAAGGVALALAGAAALWALLVWWRPAHPRSRGVALLALVGLLALLAYWVRPALPAPALGGDAGELDRAARESLVRLGWYVSPLGLLLALVGAGLLLRRDAWARALPLLGLLALSLAFYLPNPLVSSDQPWAARRYLPLVLPALLLLAGYGAATLAALVAPRRPRIRALTSLALALAVAAGEWQATEPVAAYQEHLGAVRQVEALAALFPADAIVLFPRSTAGMRLALPLQYLGERGTFVLPAEGPVEGVLEAARRWRAAGRPVYWVVPLGTRFPTPPGVRFAPAGQFTFAVDQLERPLDRLPRVAEPLRFELQLYRLELASEVPNLP